MNIEVHAIGPLLRRTINSIESLYGLSSSRWSADWDGESLVFGRAEVLKDELLELWNCPDRPSLELQCTTTIIFPAAGENNFR